MVKEKDENPKPPRGRKYLLAGPPPADVDQKQTSQTDAEKKELMERDELGRELLSVAHFGTKQQFDALLERGADIHYVDPKHNTTVLHRAASAGARDFIADLIEKYDFDFLIKDSKGRLPSAVAMELGDDPELSKLLMEREIEQAKREKKDYKSMLVGKQSGADGPA